VFDLVGPGRVTSVKDDLMTLIDEQRACRQAEPG